MGNPNADRAAWTKADAAHRLQWLQRLENHQAKLEKRAPAQVRLSHMSSNQRGFYNPATNTIHMNHDAVKYMDKPDQILTTLYHESRHAYQADVVKRPEVHPEVSPKDREAWAQNLRHYRQYTKERVDKISDRLLREREKNMTPEQVRQYRKHIDNAVYRSYHDHNVIEEDARKQGDIMFKKWEKQEEKLRIPPEKQAIQKDAPVKETGKNGLHSVSHNTSAKGHASALASVGGKNGPGGHGSSGGHSGLGAIGGHTGAGHGGSSGGHSGLGAVGGHTGAGHGGSSGGGHGGSGGGHGGTGGGHGGH